MTRLKEVLLYFHKPRGSSNKVPRMSSPSKSKQGKQQTKLNAAIVQSVTEKFAEDLSSMVLKSVLSENLSSMILKNVLSNFEKNCEVDGGGMVKPSIASKFADDLLQNIINDVLKLDILGEGHLCKCNNHFNFKN